MIRHQQGLLESKREEKGMEKSRPALSEVLEKSTIAADRLEHKELIFTYGGEYLPRHSALLKYSNLWSPLKPQEMIFS